MFVVRQIHVNYQGDHDNDHHPAYILFVTLFKCVPSHPRPPVYAETLIVIYIPIPPTTT